MQRKSTMAKIIEKEEKRIETASQVSGTTLTLAEQLQRASALLKPNT